jgi:hypothetical protein
VAEWFKAPVLKTGRGSRLSWVRIPPLPPGKNKRPNNKGFFRIPKAASMKLPRAIKDESGKTLRTTHEAKRYVLAKLKARPGYQSWKRAAELLVEGAALERVTTQLEYGLLLDGQLDVKFTQEQTM